MATTNTTLAIACAAGDDTIRVTSATGFSVGKLVKMENEFARVKSVSGTAIGLSLRGDNGTKAVAHNILSPISVGDAADFPGQMPQGLVNTYGAAGAIAIPADGKDVTVILAAASAAAMTLADPTGPQEGMTMIIIAKAAQAYTVTNTTGFGAGGGSLDVATFGGAVGDNMVITAIGAKWHVVSKVNVTLG